MQEHVAEQLDVVAVLERLAVEVGGAQDERAVYRPPFRSMTWSSAAEGAVRQVVQYRVAAEDVTDGSPGGGLAEDTERGDLDSRSSSVHRSSW